MFFKAAALAALSFFPIAAVAQSGGGSATWFHPGLGACGFINTDSDFVVAVSSQIFNSGLCNRRMNANYQGRSVQVTVVDSCPGCGAGDIDLSPAAFSQLADLSVGRIQPVQWNIV
ncbi:DPBB1 domain-containing protein [Stygiomarasmius scandens]|uniref:DPBB1 domain-containing protein n=1 Tax=Marasmiellus scandens TaxID=2682957 RepID=A0ABR1JIA3_9AGAR